MRWQGNRQSENVEDRRGARGPVMVGGGIGVVVLVLLVLVFQKYMVQGLTAGSVKG